MPETVEFRLVDAFAETPFTGNSAGVVLNADGLDDSQMQRIAREVNAAETAFIVGGNDLHRPTRLRWFTPAIEVGFCGHATLAAAHAWTEVAGQERFLSDPDAFVEFDSAAGPLRLTAEPIPNREDAPLWWMRAPEQQLRSDNSNPMRTCELLGMTIDDLDPAAPVMRTRDDDLILLIRSWQTLQGLTPNMQELRRFSERHKIRGLFVTTRQTMSNAIQAASRFFAPAAGIDEDPVTGSAHAALAAFLMDNNLVEFVEGHAAVNCVQGQPGGRTGLVRLLIEKTDAGRNISVGGTCYITVQGEMRVPPRDA